MLETELDRLKADVIKLLVSHHDFDSEEAELAIAESYKNDPEIWNENSDAEQLANALASEDDDE